MKGFKEEEGRKGGENVGFENRQEEKGDMEGTADTAAGRWEDDGDMQERSAARRRRRRKNRLTGSMAARIFAFFLLAASVLTGLAGTACVLYLEVHEFYTEDYDTALLNAMSREMRTLTCIVENQIEGGRLNEAAGLLGESNMDLELIQEENEEETVLWKTGRDYVSDLTVDTYIPFDKQAEKVRINGQELEDGTVYLYRAWINPRFPETDAFRNIAEWTSFLYENRYTAILLAAAGWIMSLLCFIFLMCSAGHRNGREGIVPGVLTGIPLDVLAVVFFGAAFVSGAFLLGGIGRDSEVIWTLMLIIWGVFLAVWFTLFFMDFAVRLKRGNCFRNSLIYMIIRWLGRGLCFLGRLAVTLLRGMPLILTTLMIYFGICMLEMIVVMRYCVSDFVLLWAVEKMIFLPFIMYIALTCKKFLTAGRALAEGQEDYQVDTSGMWGDFREHGENLNSIGQGISKAVAERMKSERLKTELISNVSHDLKTPLTSIINYADLIYEETKPFPGSAGEGEMAGPGEESPAEVDRAKIEEYSEVLLRQSRRLKKLLEDLMEASKATTGNLEVNLESCEVGVLLSQAVGEYQQRMTEKSLELVARQPEEPVNIMADGRHLWRVFDNLLNNICKYAQEHSRVYLSVEKKEEQVLIIFRNMSKYPLDISGEELEERFVRGDKSRHMEGNGLGLSIAKSLVELQNGRMEIVIDGDLFKVILCFPREA